MAERSQAAKRQRMEPPSGQPVSTSAYARVYGALKAAAGAGQPGGAHAAAPGPGPGAQLPAASCAPEPPMQPWQPASSWLPGQPDAATQHQSNGYYPAPIGAPGTAGAAWQSTPAPGYQPAYAPGGVQAPWQAQPAAHQLPGAAHHWSQHQYQPPHGAPAMQWPVAAPPLDLAASAAAAALPWQVVPVQGSLQGAAVAQPPWHQAGVAAAPAVPWQAWPGAGAAAASTGPAAQPFAAPTLPWSHADAAQRSTAAAVPAATVAAPPLFVPVPGGAAAEPAAAGAALPAAAAAAAAAGAGMAGGMHAASPPDVAASSALASAAARNSPYVPAAKRPGHWRVLQQPAQLQGGCQRAPEQRSQPPGMPRQVVIIWDLDETLVLFHSLISGEYARATGAPHLAALLEELGGRWQDAFLNLCDTCFFYKEVEDNDQTTVTALDGYLPGADGSAPLPGGTEAARALLAARYRSMRERYRGGLAALARLSGPNAGNLEAEWRSLFEETERLTGNWLAAAAALLAQCTAPNWAAAAARLAAAAPASSAQPAQGARPGREAQLAHQAQLASASTHTVTSGRSSDGEAGASAGDASRGGGATADSAAARGGAGGGSAAALSGAGSRDEGGGWAVANVVVTQGQLVPTLGKLLLTRLAPYFGATELWSARNEGKMHCFDRIHERFGPDAAYLVIGDGTEEEAAARVRGWPYLRVLLAPPLPPPPCSPAGAAGPVHPAQLGNGGGGSSGGRGGGGGGAGGKRASPGTPDQVLQEWHGTWADAACRARARRPDASGTAGHTLPALTLEHLVRAACLC